MNFQKSTAKTYSILTSKDCLSALREIANTQGKQALVQFFSNEQFYREVQRIIISAADNTDPQLKSQVQNFVMNISALSKDDTVFGAFSEAYSTSKWTRWSVSDAYNSKKMYDSNFVDQAKIAFIMDLNFGGARKMIEMMANVEAQLSREALREDFQHCKAIENQITTDQLNPSQKLAYSHLESFLKSGNTSDWERFNSIVKEKGVSSMADVFRTKEIRNKFEETLMQGTEGIDRVIGVLISKDGREIIKEVMKTPEGQNLVGYLWNTPEGKVFVQRMLAGKNALDGWVTVAQIIGSQLNFKGRSATTPGSEHKDEPIHLPMPVPKIHLPKPVLNHSGYQNTTTNDENSEDFYASEIAQKEFVEMFWRLQKGLEQLNKQIVNAKSEDEKEELANEINERVAAMFYYIKTFKYQFNEENQQEFKNIQKAVNADMESTAKQANLGITSKKIPPANQKYVQTFLNEIEIIEMLQQLYDDVIFHTNDSEYIKKFPQKAIFDMSMIELGMILKRMHRQNTQQIPAVKEDFKVPQYYV